MTATSSLNTAGCDTEDMRLVHRVFRVVFADGPMLVDRVAVGDNRTAQTVGRHLLDLAIALHNHHTVEDDVLWDILAERAPACALHVGLMKTQHAAMGAVLSEAEEALPIWMRTASASDRARVRASMVEIDRLLGEHLGDEERLILPTASETLTQREWNRLGDSARKETKPSMLFPQLGFMLESLTPEEGRRFMNHGLPAPVRVLWRLIGKGQYRRYRRRVYGTA